MDCRSSHRRKAVIPADNPRGILYVPKDLEEFESTGVRPMLIIDLLGAAELLDSDVRKKLIKLCPQFLGFFYSVPMGDVHILTLYTGTVPEKLIARLETIIEGPLPTHRLSSHEQEQLRDTLHARLKLLARVRKEPLSNV